MTEPSGAIFEPADTHRPSPFVKHWTTALQATVPPARRALDVAMGRGRHALLLIQQGFTVFGVDVRFDAVHDAYARALTAGGLLRAWCADLRNYPLPDRRFELIVVTRFLQRDLFPALRASLVPGGAILYETFTTAQRAKGRGPASPDHLLEPGELRDHFVGLDVLFAEEVTEPDALARLVARKPFSRS